MPRPILVELCAGSAALTRYYAKLPKLVGFMGAKDRYVEQIIEHWGLPTPQVAILNDPGYWGDIWTAIESGLASKMASQIRVWDKMYADAKPQLFADLKMAKSGMSIVSYSAAVKLCLIAGTYGGGEIGGSKGKHKLRPSVDGFIPSLEGLAERLKAYEDNHAMILTQRDRAEDVRVTPNAYVYIDPPYEGVSGYRCELDRQAVLDIAVSCSFSGSSVCISEAVPLADQLGPGWISVELNTTSGQVRKNSRTKTEFLTIYRPPK